MIHSYTRQARFVTSVAAMLACASAAQAAPASGKNKTVHIHEIHRDHTAPRVGRAVQNSASSGDAIQLRSHAELVMINPG